MSLTKSRTAKLAAGFVGVAMAVSAFVPMLASADTASDLQAQINSLLATIQSLQAQLSATTGGSTVGTGYTFNTNLTMGSTGADVLNLQKVLNSSADTQVASSGVGSPGSETSYFGALTRSAVMKFQTKYGITPVAGYVGPVTRAKLNTMGGVVVVPPPGVAGALTIVAGTQPANSLAPATAARLPFTTFTLTAGASDVTVNSVTVQQVGLANDAVFSGIVLLKSDGTQVGIAKTLNSTHQAIIGEPMVISAGTSQTFTVAGNMASAATLANYVGQVAALNVVAINTSATVSGTLPVSGAQHTINYNLTLGSVTMNTSSYDPGASQNKEVGTTGYKFAGFRVTAGSAEDVKLSSVRFNQSGSAASGDLANVAVYVDGTAYPTTVSADGKYYSALFGNGIIIAKGLSKDIWIQGDVVGTGAAGRTVKFDVYKTTDLYLSGMTYGYGITPPAGLVAVNTCSSAQSCGVFTVGAPWFNANIVTVTGGSVTSITKATNVPAANIAVNVPDQILGGFVTDIKGEPISVQTLKFQIATSGTWTSSTGITGIILVDQTTGAVVAGPEDEATTCTTGCTVTFSDTVTFPLGPHTYVLKGKLPVGTPDGATVVVSTTPTTWEGITGQVTGNTIAASSLPGVFSMNTMTVKGAALVISVSTSPAAQSIVSGGTITFTNLQLDATQSGEDVKFGAIPLYYNGGSQSTAADETKMTSCQLWDGSTALNTGSNAVNPSTTVATSTPLSQTFTLDNQYIVTKGTLKTLTLMCNVSSSADNGSKMQWGLLHGATMTVTGVTSGSDVSENLVSGNGQVMTVANGSLAASIDSSTSAYTTVAGPSSGVTIGTFKFTASNEDINLTKVGLILTNGTVSDVTTAYIYKADGTLAGQVYFTNNGTTATSTLISPVLLTKGVNTLLTIKADIGSIGLNQVGTEGQLIKIDVTNAEGSGVSSGGTLQVGSVVAGVNGVRMFKAFPVFSYSTVSGIAQTGTNDLLTLNVTANGTGDIQLYRLTFSVATTTADLTSPTFSGPSGSAGITTTLNAAGTQIDVTFNSMTPTADRIVSVGQTKTFTLRGTIALTGNSGSSGAVAVALKADGAYPTFTPSTLFMGSAATTTLAADNIVWSPDTLGVSATTTDDFTSAYGLTGCYATSGLGQDCLSRSVSK